MSLREDIAQAIRVAWVEDAEAGRSETTAETLADAVVALVEARDAQVTGSTVVAWAEQRGYKRAEAALRERLARDIEALPDYRNRGRWGWLRRDAVLEHVRGEDAS